MFNSGLMIRIGRTEEIEKQYRECYIRFSCPANWINYANNHAPGIADKFEAIFAHVDKFDPRLWMTCSDGAPLYGALWRSENSDGTVYARYLYSCLVPTVCFYSLGISKLAKQMGIKDNKPGRITIDLLSYYKAMNVCPEESSVLVIRFPGLFIPELRREIPNAVKAANNIAKADFNADNSLAVKYVKYDLDINEMFFKLRPYDEIFRKQPEYKEQHEARMIIPNVSFLRNPIYFPSLYHDNEMNVPVPELQSYSFIYPASRCKTMAFENFTQNLKRYDILCGDKE